MKKKLEKIKELLELSTENLEKRDLYVGQAIGLIDSILDTATASGQLAVPDVVWKHIDKPKSETIMDAVARHKEAHNELSKNSVSQQNTQFKKLS